MGRWSRPGYAIGRRCVDVAAGWVPEIGRADDVVEEWKRHGFEGALATSRLSRQEIIGVSDGSQRGQRGAWLGDAELG